MGSEVINIILLIIHYCVPYQMVNLILALNPIGGKMVYHIH